MKRDNFIASKNLQNKNVFLETKVDKINGPCHLVEYFCRDNFEVFSHLY